jgi:hypothetical protein
MAPMKACTLELLTANVLGHWTAHLKVEQ